MTLIEALNAPYAGDIYATTLAAAIAADAAHDAAIHAAGYRSRWDMPARAHHALPEFVAKTYADRQLNFAFYALREGA